MRQLFNRSFFQLVTGFWVILVVGIISLFVAGAYYGQSEIPDTPADVSAEEVRHIDY